MKSYFTPWTKMEKIGQKKTGVINFIHEGIEVDFSLITSGHYNEEQESIVKEFHAKILHINHETI